MTGKSPKPDHPSGQTRQKPTTSEGDPVDGTGEDNHATGSQAEGSPGNSGRESADKAPRGAGHDKDAHPGHVEKAPRGK